MSKRFDSEEYYLHCENGCLKVTLEIKSEHVDAFFDNEYAVAFECPVCGEYLADGEGE